MNVSRYLLQAVTLRSAGAVNRYGEAALTDSQIRVRWLYENEEVRTDDRKQVVSNAQVLTMATVKAGDFLVDEDGREWPILRVKRYTDLNGRFSHYKVWL